MLPIRDAMAGRIRDMATEPCFWVEPLNGLDGERTSKIQDGGATKGNDVAPFRRR
jgi:hypothetical protein